MKKHVLLMVLAFAGLNCFCQTSGAAPPKGTMLRWPKISAGDMAPDFVQYDTSGKAVRLSDYKGKYVLLDFWGSMCVPCRREHPHLIQLNSQYKGKNFVIMSVSVYDMPGHKDRWMKAIHMDKVTWMQLSDAPDKSGDPKTHKNDAAMKYGVGGLPRNFLIDPSGKIIAMDLKGQPLDDKLREVLH